MKKSRARRETGAAIRILWFLRLLIGGAAAIAEPVALNRRWLEPVPFQPDMGFRWQWNWRFEGPDDSPLRQVRLFQGENVWGANILRMALADDGHAWRGRKVRAATSVQDAAGRETDTHVAPGIPFLSAGPETERPGFFGQLAALGVRRHYEDSTDTPNHSQAFVPYRMTATSFPARIRLQLTDEGTGADLGSWVQTFPTFGFARLHVARCSPFADEDHVPAFLRLWLDSNTLAAATVRLRVIDEATGRAARQEEVAPLAARDLGFDLNLAGLPAGRYRVEAEVSGPPGLHDISAVWLERRAVPKPGRSEIPLLVEEMPGFSRARWPVTGGVPLPDGVLPADALDRCRILDAAGQALPAQFRVLATWAADRRFARWLLVDFQADSRDGACGPFSLAVLPDAAPPPVPATAIRVTSQGDGFRVDTGPLQADFADRQGRFLQQLVARPPGEAARGRGQALLDPARPVSAYMTLLPADPAAGGGAVATESALSPDIRCELEEAGPLRCVVKASGAYGRQGAGPINAFVLRLTFWAGRPEIGVEHTFVWKEDPKQWLVRDVGVRWPMRGVRGVTAPHGASPDGLSTNIAAYPAAWAVVQEGSRTNRFAGRALAGRFPGWADAVLVAGGVGVRIKDFWQQYPCGLAVDADGIDLQFWPAAHPPLDLRNAREAYYRGNARGLAKTHQAVLAWHAQPWSPQQAAEWAAWQEEPLRATAHPLTVLRSRAVGPLHPYDPERFPNEEQALDNAFRGLELQPLATDVYGNLDWGDLHSQWDRAKGRWDPDHRYWLNNETTYDATTISLWMQYLRTGRRRCFKFPERRTCHLMDVDTCHHSVNQPPHFDGADPQNNIQVVGLQHRHEAHHWSGNCMAHHTVYDDIVQYYLLTGRWRALDVIREGAASFKTYRPGSENENRGISVPFRLLGDCYWQFWDFDHWRLAAELHDLLVTYSLPDLYGQYGYLRYWIMTGDRRYGLEWMRCELVRGNALPAVEPRDFLRKPVEWDGVWNYPDPLSAAIMHEVTGDPQALTRMDQLNFLGPYSSGPGSGKLAVGIAMPLLASFPSDAADGTPPGYGWSKMAAFKYAFAMNGLFQTTGAMGEPGPVPPRQLEAPLRTNGRGGGLWSAPSSFAENRLPGPATPVVVAAGDTLLFDSGTPGPHAAEITVDDGGCLGFAPGRRALVIRGNVIIKAGGLARLTPGSALKIDCPDYSRQHGITLEGMIEADGGSPGRQDCTLGALTNDGRHGIYLRAPRGSGPPSAGFIRNCNLDDCEVVIDARGFALDGNRALNSRLKLWKITGLAVRSNDFRNCAIKMNCAVFAGNRTEGGYAELSAAKFLDNRFERIHWGLWLSGAEFAGNSYRECGDITVYAHTTATLREERCNGTYAGLRIAGKGPVSLEHCEFGLEQPNRTADLVTEPAVVTLKGCRFAPEARITVTNKDGGVLSEDHDGKPGQTRAWGKAATSASP